MKPDQVITKLQLIPLPSEGGWFRELRHVQTEGVPALPQDHGAVGDQVEGSSSIYYLVRGKERPAWHKLSIDEYWCYHSGENIRWVLCAGDNRWYYFLTLRLHLISPVGQYSTALIGDQLMGAGCCYQYLVGRETWFRVELQVLYCTVLYCDLMYCTVLYCTVIYCDLLYCTEL